MLWGILIDFNVVYNQAINSLKMIPKGMPWRFSSESVRWFSCGEGEGASISNAARTIRPVLYQAKYRSEKALDQNVWWVSSCVHLSDTRSNPAATTSERPRWGTPRGAPDATPPLSRDSEGARRLRQVEHPPTPTHAFDSQPLPCRLGLYSPNRVVTLFESMSRGLEP